MKGNKTLRRSALAGAAASVLVWSAWGQADEKEKPTPVRAEPKAAPTADGSPKVKAAPDAEAVPTRATKPAPQERALAAPSAADSEGPLKAKAPKAAKSGLARAAAAEQGEKEGDESDESDDAADSAEKKKRGANAPGRSLALARYQAARHALMEARSSGPSSEESKEARKKALERLAEAREAILKQHRESAEAFRKRPKKERESLEEKVDEHREKLKKDREERAKKAREKLKKRFGAEPLHPALREELRAHAWRVARLNQLLFLAKADDKTQLVERAEKLLAKEKQAHEARVAQLMEKPEIKNYEPPPSDNAGKPEGAGKPDATARAAKKPAEVGKPAGSKSPAKQPAEKGEEQ